MEQVQLLTARVASLEAQVNQNSKNSHQPPSSDGPKKRPAFSKKGSKKRGGQKGHRGKTLEMVMHPHHTIIHQVERCSCGQNLSRAPKYVSQRRQVFDLPVPCLEVTEHQQYSCICPRCHKINVGVFPSQVVAPTQYGSGVRTLVVLLQTGLNVSYRKVRQFFTDLFDYQLNEATQINTQDKCYELLQSSEEVIQSSLLNSPVNHFDETGIRVAGNNHWLHNCSNDKFTYQFVHRRRGQVALDDPASLIPHYGGWAVHDCWSSYFKYKGCQHAICAAHLLRELQALIEQDRSWAKRMQELLMYAYEQSDKGRGVAQNLQKIGRQYDRICQMANQEEPLPKQRYANKRPKQTKGRNLLNRLVKYKSSVLAFAHYQQVPFTNNQAERDVRPTKTKIKVAGCFRTKKGADIYARIQSFISTTRKHQRNVFNELVAVFDGCSFLTAQINC